MLLPSTGISGLSFDPFLRDVHGADLIYETEAIFRALATLRRHDVLVAYRERVDVGRLDHLQGLRVPGRCPIEVGDSISLSERRGDRHVGVRAAVADVVWCESGTAIRLETPAFAVFSPGRRHFRVSGALGAQQVVLEVGGRRLTCTPRDISISGLGLDLAQFEDLSVGDRALVNLHFEEERVSVHATVRRCALGGDGVRVGLEFDRQDPRIASRLEEAMT